MHPMSLGKVTYFLGIEAFYRWLMPSCVEIARPLTVVLAQRVKSKNVELDNTQINAVQDFKSAPEEQQFTPMHALTSNKA